MDRRRWGTAKSSGTSAKQCIGGKKGGTSLTLSKVELWGTRGNRQTGVGGLKPRSVIPQGGGGGEKQ